MAVNPLNLSIGFRNDVQNLLTKFVESEEIKMATFTRIWREMKFLQVFMYREDKEIILFTEECFRIILSCIVSAQPLSFRIGGLFCLYSMYIMQPCEPKLKIRLTADNWKGLNKIVDECQLESCESEIQYVFWTLFYQNAFLFVAKATAVSLQTVATDDDSTSKHMDLTASLEEYVNSDNKYLKTIHERYMTLKDSLNPSASKTVQMVERDLFTEIKEKVSVLKEKYALAPVDPSLSKGPYTTSSEDEPDEMNEANVNNYSDEDTLERRRQVRKKHQAIQVQQRKSRRHRVEKTVNRVTKGRGRGAKRTMGRPRKCAAVSEEGERPFRGVSLSEEVDVDL